MGHDYLYPGQKLWYCNRNTRELNTVEVIKDYMGEFIICYQGKRYRLPYSALGTRLFFTREGAACPSEILNRREKRKEIPTGSGIDFQYYEAYDPFDDDRDYWERNYYTYSKRDSGDSNDNPPVEMFGLWIDKY